MGEGEDEETIAAHQKHHQHQIQLSIEKQYKLVVKKIVRPNIPKTQEAVSDRLHEDFYHSGVILYIVPQTTGK